MYISILTLIIPFSHFGILNPYSSYLQLHIISRDGTTMMKQMLKSMFILTIVI